MSFPLKYTPEQKAEAVQRVNDLRATFPHDHTIVRQVSKDLGIEEQTIRIELRKVPGTKEWNKNHSPEKAATPEVSLPQLDKLEAENENLRAQNTALKELLRQLLTEEA